VSRLHAIAAALAMSLWAAWDAPALAQAQTPNVQADLLSSRSTIAPDERFTIVLRQRIREGWHTYWRNPGDSGEPTRITWHLPAGWRAGEIQWPAPVAMRFATLMSYVYSNEVLFPIELTAPPTLRAGETVTLNAEGDWLVCSDICIPEHATLSLLLPVGAQGSDDPQWAPRIAQALASLPRRLGVEAHITPGNPAMLSIALPNATAIRDPYFFPYDQDAIRHAATEEPRVGPGGLSFRLAQGADHNLGRGPLSGVLTFVTAQGERRAVEVETTPGATLPATDAAPAQSSAPIAALPAPAAAAPIDAAALFGAVVFAFLGGLILNLMPCVLPVLSVKALSLAEGAHREHARREGVLYFAGVLATFLALALVLIVIREGGETIGWGFQLQMPGMSAALALLFFAIGLNLLGVFGVSGAQNAGAGAVARGGDAGAFFTGALAVVAATPCTAPFMAGAVGVALTQSVPVALTIFAALAVGFALPLTALSLAPALQRLLPRPGAWMERVRNVLAFPMFGAAAWLAWVLAQQSGATGVLALLALATALAFAIVVARWGRIWLIVGAGVLALTVLFAWKPLTEVHAPAASAQSWSAARVAELRAQGRPVFVNFTAAWCITCKVNEATTFSSPRVRDVMRAHGVVYLEADWTNRNDAIAAELAAHGRAGVPLYLYYPPGGGAAVVLPQILSETALVNAIGA
jgi:thiol:disulfide interchange protein/DsbC/DsbD-like thiol-disulfide interchange protein